jgi:hypothetical protein
LLSRFDSQEAGALVSRDKYSEQGAVADQIRISRPVVGSKIRIFFNDVSLPGLGLETEC